MNLEIRAQVIFLVNQQRANYGLRTLASNSTLATTAQQWSNRMSADRWMRHSSHAPENVAMGYNSAQSVMDAWMASDGHRRNILDPRAVYVGAGFLNGFWTLQFGY